MSREPPVLPSDTNPSNGAQQPNLQTYIDRVDRLTIKLPPLWKNDVQLWFNQIEAQFRSARITAEQTKFDLVVGNLELPDLADVRDLINNPPAEGPYLALKARLVAVHQDSEDRQITKLLNELELGDKRPSSLLREMRALAGTRVKDDFLKSIFFKYLPLNVRQILSVAMTTTLDDLATMADKIMEVNATSSSTICAIPAQPESSQSDLISELTRTLKDLRAEIASVKEEQQRLSRSRSRDASSTHGRRSTPHRSQRRSRTPKFANCWYHFKFGAEARKCIPPCNQASGFSPAPASEN